jgi:hypothetical protein
VALLDASHPLPHVAAVAAASDGELDAPLEDVLKLDSFLLNVSF